MNVGYQWSLLFCCLLGLLSVPMNGQSLQTPASIAFTDFCHTYDGSYKTPTIVTNPANLPVQVTYSQLDPAAPPPISEIVFNDAPHTLELSYASYPFQAQQISALGNLVELAGSSRKLESCDTILVSWARPEDWPEWYERNPAGFNHPITITIYEVSSSNRLIFRTEVTQDVLIPWRPATLPNGNKYPYNGSAFRASIAFPNGITLPERVLVMLSFNTQSSGFYPIGTPGPYNVLNVAQRSIKNVTPVGTDVNPDVILQVKNGVWYYPASGFTYNSVPMISLKALSSQTTNPPSHAGSWKTSARITNPDYSGTASCTFTIEPAHASVELCNLIHSVDGNCKPATVITNPEEIATITTYNGSTTPPLLPGTYTVQTTISDPNYLPATANAELTLHGHTMTSWLEPWLTNSQIPADASGATHDPDQDSIPNLMEYALGLDPSTANHGTSGQAIPHAALTSNDISLIYRKNLGATELTYQVESATRLDQPNAWAPATTSDTVIATEGLIQTISATLHLPPQESQRFLRLKVSRPEIPEP